VSLSEYLEIYKNQDDEEPLYKVRISDHADVSTRKPAGKSTDITIRLNENFVGQIKELVDDFEKETQETKDEKPTLWQKIKGLLDFNTHHDPKTGQFTSGGGSGKKSKNTKSEEEFFGEAYPQYSGKPQEAIEHLLKVKKGHVPSAIYKEGIGNIDFVYGEAGEEGYGLAHILEKRSKDGLDAIAFVKNIPNLIDKGTLDDKHKSLGRMYINSEKDKVIIRLDYDNKDRKWLVSTFRDRKDL